MRIMQAYARQDPNPHRQFLYGEGSRCACAPIALLIGIVPISIMIIPIHMVHGEPSIGNSGPVLAHVRSAGLLIRNAETRLMDSETGKDECRNPHKDLDSRSEPRNPCRGCDMTRPFQTSRGTDESQSRLVSMKYIEASSSAPGSSTVCFGVLRVPGRGSHNLGLTRPWGANRLKRVSDIPHAIPTSPPICHLSPAGPNTSPAPAHFP